LRVIAGTAKGTRLAPVPAGVRPLSDRAREGLFSSLGPAAAGARVLDLYAGTGALGVEALSRGADRAVFVDRDRGALRAVEENLARTRLADRARSVRAEAVEFLMRDDKREGPFDLVFADPPYDAPAERVDALLAALARGWLDAGWAVALARPVRSSTHVIPVDWRASKGLKYGDTAVLIFREA
jgi:16S rRNA (guanine(966)-N(2))-methyltransferase RsmD